MSTSIKYTAEPYTGRSIGSSYLIRTGWQVVATDATTGKRRAIFRVGRGRSPCLKFGWVAQHYRTGRSKADEIKYRAMRLRAIEAAKRLNSPSSSAQTANT